MGNTVENQKDIQLPFEAANESPSIFEVVFRHFVITLSEKKIIIVVNEVQGHRRADNRFQENR